MTRSLERLVLDALPLAVHAADLDGRITLANASWRRIARTNGAAPATGADGLVGRPIWEALADIATREQLVHAMDTLRAGRAASMTWEFAFGPHDAARVGTLQVSALRDERALSGYLFVIADGTATHRSHEQLLEAGIALADTIALEQVLQEMTQQLQRATGCDGVAIALADGAEDPPRLVHHAGFDHEPTASAGVVDAELERLWRAAREQRRIITRHTARGRELTAPLLGAEEVLGVVTIIIEQPASTPSVAELERTLATIAAQGAASIERAWQVRRVERRRRLEAIGEVATGVARELRNPLFGISSAAQLLRFRVREDPVVEKNVGRILREVERLNAMMTSLLEYGRPAPQKLRDSDLDEVWDEVLETQRGLLEAKALRVIRSRPRQHATCRVDPEQLSQVFLHLLANAVDAAPEGTDLSLASQRLPSGGWRWQLHNGGAPIPAEALPHVFELFFSTKPSAPGIGLALCQRIVEEHGGSIGIDSGPQGTTVSLTLPTTSAPAAGVVERNGQFELSVGTDSGLGTRDSGLGTRD